MLHTDIEALPRRKAEELLRMKDNSFGMTKSIGVVISSKEYKDYEEMIIKYIDNFNLEQICQSGQCFRIKKAEDGGWKIIAADRYLKIWQQGRETRFYCDEEEYETVWREYFDLDTDYTSYMAQVNPKDEYLVQAVNFGKGMRILKQDLWEMIVSFLISQQNNIVRIRRCIENLCVKYGEKRENAWGESYYTFPKPETLAGLSEDALKECNLGYRSKYVVRGARSVVSGDVRLHEIEKMSYKKAKEALLQLFGVGEKVADCICLFALHHLDAFPVDTHIHQALERHYKRGFPNRRYRGFRGVIQQYIFYYELAGKMRKGK